MADIKCAECGSLQKKKHIDEGKCWRCKTEYDVSVLQEKSAEKPKPANQIVYPKCPNIECENHLGHIPPKDAFRISVLEDGLLGKIFKSESLNIVSCKKCGHIIGVSGKGG